MSRNPAHIRPVGRGLHLVDLDNLVGGPWNAGLVPQVLPQYLSTASYVQGDHLVVAADAHLATTAMFQLPVGGQFLVARGTNGADNRLLELLTTDHIVTRYSRMVIGSGDHCFAGLAREVRSLGGSVSVVARRGTLARSLQAACNRTLWLTVAAGVSAA